MVERYIHSFFQPIFEHAAEGILIVNEQSIILMANHSAEEIFGYEKGELAQKEISDLIVPHFRQAHKPMMKQFFTKLQARPMGHGRDLTGYRKDHSVFPIEVSISTFLIEKDMHAVVLVSDIQERKMQEIALKESETKLQQYAADLEKKVAQRTRELNETIERLEKALTKERELYELKSQFTSIASHEFRTPLSIIKGSASLIKNYFDQPEKISNHLRRIDSAVEQMKAILNDFMVTNKLDENHVEVQLVALDVQQFLQQIQDSFTPLLKPTQQFSVHAWTHKPFWTDEKILHTIVSNLVSNAIKYTPEGSIDIIPEKIPNGLRISVKDTGIGIPKKDVTHIADRFYRAENAAGIQGTGLGLSIVKSYTELLHGKFSFSSEQNKGSIFVIEIPEPIPQSYE